MLANEYFAFVSKSLMVRIVLMLNQCSPAIFIHRDTHSLASIFDIDSGVFLNLC